MQAITPMRRFLLPQHGQSPTSIHFASYLSGFLRFFLAAGGFEVTDVRDALFVEPDKDVEVATIAPIVLNC